MAGTWPLPVELWHCVRLDPDHCPLVARPSGLQRVTPSPDALRHTEQHSPALTAAGDSPSYVLADFVNGIEADLLVPDVRGRRVAGQDAPFLLHHRFVRRVTDNMIDRRKRCHNLKAVTEVKRCAANSDRVSH